MSGEQLLGIAAIISAIAGPLVVYMQARLSRQLTKASDDNLAATAEVRDEVVEVKAEVVSGNEQTMGRLAARTETRRIEDIPPADRTSQEQRHVDEDPQHVGGGSL